MNKKRFKKYIAYCKSKKLKFKEKYKTEIDNSEYFNNYLSSLDEEINRLEIMFKHINKK